MPPEGWEKSEVLFESYFDPLWKLRLEARKIAREMWVVYQEFVSAGFNEEQALALTVSLMREEGE